MLDVILKSFDEPDEVRHFERGRFELVSIGGLTIGRATYEPGWKWSQHVGPSVGMTRCDVEHVGLVVSGHATAAFDDGRLYDLTPGMLSHSGRASRQLGRRRRIVRVAPLPGRLPLRKIDNSVESGLLPYSYQRSHGGMKISVSLPDEDVEFLDAYAKSLGFRSRSAVVQRAVRLMRAQELGPAYAEAWKEWQASDDADAWDPAVGDGSSPYADAARRDSGR